MDDMSINGPMLDLPGKEKKGLTFPLIRKRSSSGNIPIAFALFLVLFFSGCEKDLSDSKRIYRDDLQDTDNIELSIDTSSMPNNENDFSIEHEEGLVKFHAHGEGEAVGRVELSELLPELEDQPKISIRVHFERFSKSRFEYEGGPIVILDTKSSRVSYIPSTRGSARTEDLPGTDSFTFHIDQRIASVKVVRDQSKEVDDHFLKGDPLNENSLSLEIGATSALTGPGSWALETDVHLDRIEVFTP